MLAIPSIDKVRLGVQLPKKYVVEKIVVNPIQELYDMLDKYALWYKSNPDTPYSDKWLLVGDLGYIELNKYEYRLYWEFNPNKIDMNHELFADAYGDIYSVLCLARYAWYSRVDIALDMDLDLDKHYIFSKTKKKQVIYLNGNKKESHYFGSRQSDIMFRFYDKEKESAGGTLPTHMVNMTNKTRFEIEIKKRVDEPVTTDFINSLVEDIIIIPKDYLLEQLKAKTDLKTALALTYIVENNRMDLLNEFAKSTRSRYKKIIADIGNVENAIIPLQTDLAFIVDGLNHFREWYNVFALRPIPF